MLLHRPFPSWTKAGLRTPEVGVSKKSFELLARLAHWQTLLSMRFLIFDEFTFPRVDKDRVNDFQYRVLL